MKGNSVFVELRRRRVVRVAAAYAVVAWLLAQVGSVTFAAFAAPAWVMKVFLVVLVLGFPVALVLAWAYELTPGSVVRQQDATQGRPAAALGRKIDYFIIALLSAALVYIAVAQFHVPGSDPVPVDPASVTDGHVQSIAVLPFAFHGSDADGALFADGMHDDLLTQLARVGGLRVISRTSMMEYRGTIKNIREIARELDVKHVLEGSVQKVGQRIRVNAQLIDATMDAHLWADSFDRELTTENIFEIQGEISRQIALRLHATLHSSGSGSAVLTRSVDAYRSYATAIKWRDQEVDGRLKASAHFREAVEKDPEFAMAWLQLAENHSAIYWFHSADGENRSSAEAALARAVALAPSLPEIHYVRALFRYRFDRDFAAALDELEVAEKLMPGNVEVILWQGYALRRLRRFEDAVVKFRQAMQLDPRNESAALSLAIGLNSLRRFREARTFLDDFVQRFADASPAIVQARVTIDVYQYGDWNRYVETQQAIATADRERASVAVASWVVGDPQKGLEVLSPVSESIFTDRSFVLATDEIRGHLFASAGRKEEADEHLVRARALYREHMQEDPRDHRAYAAAARTEFALGNKAEAVRLAGLSVDIAKGRFQDDALSMAYALEYPAHTLCAAGEFDAAASLFRHMLSQQNEFTLAYLTNGWPPCRNVFRDTPQYAALEEAFGHYSYGRGSQIASKPVH